MPWCRCTRTCVRVCTHQEIIGENYIVCKVRWHWHKQCDSKGNHTWILNTHSVGQGTTTHNDEAWVSLSTIGRDSPQYLRTLQYNPAMKAWTLHGSAVRAITDACYL